MMNEEWVGYMERFLVSKAYPCHFDDEERGGEIYETLPLAFATQRGTEKTLRYTERVVVKSVEFKM